MSFCKAVVIVDLPVGPKEGNTLLPRILDAIDLDQDIFVTEGILDVLDHSAPQACFGGKIGVDGTTRMKGEKERDQGMPDRKDLWRGESFSARLRLSEEAFMGERLLYPEGRHPLLLLFVATTPGRGGSRFANLLLSSSFIPEGYIVVLFESSSLTEDLSTLLWRAASNVDPLRDIYRSKGRMVVNACIKTEEDGLSRPWPPEIVMSGEVKKRIEEKLGDILGT